MPPSAQVPVLPIPPTPSTEPASTEAVASAGEAATPRRGPLARRLYKGLGLAFLGLAVAGVVLPGLPATPFALLAAWALRRGSPEWATRLERHPRFGPMLRAWRERRAVPRRAKVLAVLSMAASYAVLWLSGAPTPVLALVAVTLLLTGSYLVSRPGA